MTRSRAVNNAVGELTATYYAQRASAGLIITEGTAPSADGLGYARTPGIYSPEQVEGWKKVTKAVHEKGSKIFLQIMHVGRVGHPLNMRAGASLQAPSAIAAQGDMWTDSQQMQPMPVPHAMSLADIKLTVQDYVQAAKNAVAAGFDGVELHGANGYLLNQFYANNANHRTDEYGGSLENMLRFPLEVTDAVIAAIGKDKVGYRVSPGNNFNDVVTDEPEALFSALAKALNDRGIVYLHIMNPFGVFTPADKSFEVVATLRSIFKGTLISTGKNTKEIAEKLISENKADLTGFGYLYLGNPDLVERLHHNQTLAMADQNTFYTPGEHGYTDYPTFKASASN
jgi:N-ethylmaleimide reductase